MNKIFKIGGFIENIKNLSNSDKLSITLKYNLNFVHSIKNLLLLTINKR